MVYGNYKKGIRDKIKFSSSLKKKLIEIKHSWETL